MRDELGFICVAFDGTCYQLFGLGERGWANLEENGLTLFRRRLDLNRAREGLLSTGRYRYVRRARLYLRIAQTERDLQLLRRKQALIVIQGAESDQCRPIFGAYVSGTVREFDSASYYYENGLTPFRSFGEAERCAEQIARQSGSPAHPASIKLEWLQ